MLQYPGTSLETNMQLFFGSGNANFQNTIFNLSFFKMSKEIVKGKKELNPEMSH